MNMKRSRISNSVSWASGANLCQVKLFSSEDCPVKVGLKYQDHLQAKASSMLNSIPAENDFPPGFEGSFSVGQSKVELPHIPRIQWKSPSKFVISPTWEVAAGEESEEAKAQESREMRVLEAVYPRFSAIPPNPSVSLDVEGEHYDDSLTPFVPDTPIEEESPDLLDLETPVNTNVGCQPPILHQGLLASGKSKASKCNSPGLQQLASDQPVLGNLFDLNADVTAAASAALTAIMKSTEKGSLVDTGLLIKILSDPKMIQKLSNESGPQANAGLAPRPKTLVPSIPSSHPKSDMQGTAAGGNFCPMPGTVGTALNTIPHQPNNVQLSRLNRPTPPPPLPSPKSNFFMLPSLPNQNQAQPPQPPLSAMTQPNRPPLPPFPLSAMNDPNRAPLPLFPAKEAGHVKDVNYFKNLIMQHGVEIQDPFIAQNGNNHNHLTDLKMVQNFKRGETKPCKNRKPCLYFKSSRGCRNGVNCTFQHDTSCQWPTGSVMEAHSAKRMKLTGFNTGRM